jgi:hypothetical protein
MEKFRGNSCWGCLRNWLNDCLKMDNLIICSIFCIMELTKNKAKVYRNMHSGQ